MAPKDQELEAIRSVIAALEPLDDQGRSRVLEYVLKRLQMAAVRAPLPNSRNYTYSLPPLQRPEA